MADNRKSGQALVELAIFGAIAIAALGFLIKVGMKMNHDQEIRMAAFRRAMAAASADNGTDKDAMATTFYYSADRGMPNPGDVTMMLPRVRTEASAFVEWGDRMTFANKPDDDDDGKADGGFGFNTQPQIVVRSNSNEKVYHQEEFLPDSSQTTRSDGIITKAVTRNISSGIVSNGSGSGSTTTTTTLDVNVNGGDRL